MQRLDNRCRMLQLSEPRLLLRVDRRQNKKEQSCNSQCHTCPVAFFEVIFVAPVPFFREARWPQPGFCYFTDPKFMFDGKGWLAG